MKKIVGWMVMVSSAIAVVVALYFHGVKLNTSGYRSSTAPSNTAPSQMPILKTKIACIRDEIVTLTDRPLVIDMHDGYNVTSPPQLKLTRTGTHFIMTMRDDEGHQWGPITIGDNQNFDWNTPDAKKIRFVNIWSDSGPTSVQVQLYAFR